MSLKTLSTTDKAAWVAACKKEGITLTPSMEHIAALAGQTLSINWPVVLQYGVKIAIAILSAFGITLSPAPTEKACAPGCCDHCDCCCKCVEKTLDLLKFEMHHMCCCMDECNHFG